MTDQSPPPKQRKINSEDLSSLEKTELIERYEKQREYLEELEAKLKNSDNEKEKRSLIHTNRRENVLMMRLAAKEQEVQEYITQINHIRKVQEDASLLSLRQANLDPGVNLLFGRMREELQQTKDKLEQAQSELSAWKFTPDSQNGKKLISRCRTLIAENQELGKQLSQGKTAELEAELALQKKYSKDLKDSQDELNEFVIQLDEEVEGMQSTIQVLQQQLATAQRECEQNKEIIRQYENAKRLKEERQRKRANGRIAYEDVSASENEQSVLSGESDREYNEAEKRPLSPQSSSVEEGEYSSSSERNYVNDDASVTGYSTDHLDDYEILETPDDINEKNDPESNRSTPHTSRSQDQSDFHEKDTNLHCKIGNC